ncbi:tRNA 4-thiouridine(8) synthase ThiI [Candidatus Peregrinibacteria bacterium]|jgi:tRNA uracil 4-sulfurtransferase|nr:tRNA 4-thiouridine(8) synthase ThiI [Candidatus Peregrinibacteria bacterium]MBT4055690.1 tRNA 4-thiouridine(8) synthase ThiI [Candidatus Peregrinibacteria bacterium]
MDRYLIIHYSEIGLKGGNKKFFVEALNKHVSRVLSELGLKGRPKYVLNRLMVKLPDDVVEDDLVVAMRRVPGIRNFGIYYKSSSDLEKLGRDMVKKIPFERISGEGLQTFCVRVKKSEGKFDFTSVEAERELGAVLLRGDIGLKVKMKGSDLEVFVELIQDKAYFCLGKWDGISGLPVGTGGKVLSLISSGFDSPVASFMMMRRGAKVSFVHFSGQPYSGKDELEHVKEIVEILSGYQGEAKLIIIPFGEIQKKISMNTKVLAKLRVVLYRRLMFKIAEKVASRERARALVTGESFGQVASQTLVNMNVIDRAVDLPVFRPLIGLNKEEIIDMSREIGTHDISKEPCSDTCGLFMPKSPELAAKMREVLECEESIGFDELVKEVLVKREVFKV